MSLPTCREMEGEMDDGGTESGERRVRSVLASNLVRDNSAIHQEAKKKTLNTVQGSRKPHVRC